MAGQSFGSRRSSPPGPGPARKLEPRRTFPSVSTTTKRTKRKEQKKHSCGYPLLRPRLLECSLRSPLLLSPTPPSSPATPADGSPAVPSVYGDGGGSGGGYCRAVARRSHGAPAGSEGLLPRRRRARAQGGHGQVWYAPFGFCVFRFGRLTSRLDQRLPPWV